MDPIVVSHVCKSYGGTKVLTDVSASFESGKIHGIVGRNGSGKTVLFKCICGITAYDAGKITVGGRVVGKDVEMAQDVGVMIENPGFLPQESAYRNLLFLVKLSGRASKSEVRRAIDLVGLDSGSRKHVGKFSLGMRQRLGIAQAIMEDPSILILDEPLSGLDKQGLSQIRELFLAYRDEGKTILIASHSSEDINVLCDTVYEMDDGSLNRLR